MGNIFIVMALGEAIIPAKIFLKLGHVGCVFSAYWIISYFQTQRNPLARHVKWDHCTGEYRSFYI